MADAQEGGLLHDNRDERKRDARDRHRRYLGSASPNGTEGLGTGWRTPWKETEPCRQTGAFQDRNRPAAGRGGLERNGDSSGGSGERVLGIRDHPPAVYRAQTGAEIVPEDGAVRDGARETAPERLGGDLDPDRRDFQQGALFHQHPGIFPKVPFLGDELE